LWCLEIENLIRGIANEDAMNKVRSGEEEGRAGTTKRQDKCGIFLGHENGRGGTEGGGKTKEKKSCCTMAISYTGNRG